jgi:hypothetical protein
MISEHFYAALGKFLYALAESDGTVQQKEVKEVENFVNEKSAQLRHDGLEETANNLLIMKISFQNGIENKIHSGTAAKDLTDFLASGFQNRITLNDKIICREIIEKIIHSYGGIQQEELKLVSQVMPMLT